MDNSILFNGNAIQSVMDGSKTQTRCVVKTPVPDGCKIGWTFTDSGGPEDFFFVDEDGDPTDSELKCPYGLSGNRLWVKEPWAYRGSTYGDGKCEAHVTYLSDEIKVDVPFKSFEGMCRVTPHQNLKYPKNIEDLDEYEAGNVTDDLIRKWWKDQKNKPPGTMPKWASRIILEVTDVWVERVKEISKADAQRDLGPSTPNPTKDFRDNWNIKHAKHGWNTNPWVWVVQFKRLP